VHSNVVFRIVQFPFIIEYLSAVYLLLYKIIRMSRLPPCIIYRSGNVNHFGNIVNKVLRKLAALHPSFTPYRVAKSIDNYGKFSKDATVKRQL